MHRKRDCGDYDNQNALSICAGITSGLRLVLGIQCSLDCGLRVAHLGVLISIESNFLTYRSYFWFTDTLLSSSIPARSRKRGGSVPKACLRLNLHSSRLRLLAALSVILTGSIPPGGSKLTDLF